MAEFVHLHLHTEFSLQDSVVRIPELIERVANLGSEIRDNGPVGTRIENPDIDYSKIASGMGWWTSGPVSDPKELGGVLKKAVEVVKSGQPAFVDVISQPR